MAGPDLALGDPSAAPAPLRVRPGPGVLRAGAASPLAAAVEARPAGPVVRTLVRAGPDGIAALRRHGAELGAQVGDIVTARVPLAALPSLLGHPSIRRMEVGGPLYPQALLAPSGVPGAGAGRAERRGVPERRRPLDRHGPPAASDSAAADAGFTSLRRRVGSRWEGLAGQGVIVGVFDSGLDLDHDDFRHPDGRTRVLFAWDQTATAGGAPPGGAGALGGGPPGAVGASSFDYGVECRAAAIDAGACPMVDRIGHGTHVTGVAAGDGSATGRGMDPFRFPGGAPAADLIVVKGGDGVFTPDGLVDGVAYIFARAEALGRPAVVNISLSSQSGPHDGTLLFEEALDALSGPGRIVVSGAGNSGDHRNTVPVVPNGPVHASAVAGQVLHGVRIPPYTPTPGDANDGVVLELWYEGADSLTISVRSPRGDAVTAATGDSASITTPGGAVAILNALGGPAPGNGDHGAMIVIFDFDAGAPPDSGRWAVEVAPAAVHAAGEYHLWLVGHALSEAEGLPRLEGGTSNRFLVGPPASADRVLAAGAHVTRHGWTTVDGGSQTFPYRESLGDIAYFSSPGPRRDGVQKPDVTAPGKMVVSALADGALLFDAFPWLIEQDSVHAALLGTSMAAPQLAAAVALLLQIQPDLTPEEARDLLRLSARGDPFVAGPLPSPVWGHGKLDAAAAVQRLRPQGLTAPGERVALSANPVRGDGLVINYSERPRSVAVYTLIAERVRGFSAAEIGPLSTVWPLDTDAGAPAANGAYVLVVEFGDGRVLRKLLLARP